MQRKHLALPDLSAGLREILQRCKRAIGIGPDGTIYTACLGRAGGVVLDRKPAREWMKVTVPEPEGVTWQPRSREPWPIRFWQVSEGLRRALEQGHWHGEQHRAKGEGPDGTRYAADAYFDYGTPWGGFGSSRRRTGKPPVYVSIDRLPYHWRDVVSREPPGVVWKPVPAAEKSVKLAEVSEGLRKALEGAPERGWSGTGAALGVAPDGSRCRADLRDGLVFIEEDLPAGALTDHRMAEPGGIVWMPHPSDQEYAAWAEVSEGLRKILERGPRGRDGRRLADAVGSDGTEYEAWRRGDEVIITAVYAPTSTEVTMPEPAGTVWEPLEPDFRPPLPAEVSEGLRQAIAGERPPGERRYAEGIGPDGTRYHAGFYPDRSIWMCVPEDGGRIELEFWDEPEGVAWRSTARPWVQVRLTQVSAELRRALEASLWPDGRRVALGIGPDGVEYDALIDGGWVRIYETFAGERFMTAIPEPTGVTWRPSLTQAEWLPLAEVSEGLRAELRKARGRAVVGERADGADYRAFVWHRRLVFIYPAGAVPYPTCRELIPLPEPQGVTWRQLIWGQDW